MKFTKLTLAAMLLATSIVAPSWGFEPENPECIAPADAGGGWDFTCRQVGKTLYDLGLIPTVMQVTNRSGGGGGVAYAEVANKRNDDDNLIVAASAATATRLAQGAYPGNTMADMRWIGAIGADYGVIAVAANSEITSLTALFAAIKADPASISFAGGSAVGGWDHLKVLLLAQKIGVNNVRKIKYVAFDGGGEAVTQILAGSVQAFTGDVSEVLGFMESGDLRAIAVMSPVRLSGALAAVATAKEQGIDVIGANWRGFYAPGKMSDAAYTYWSTQIHAMYATPQWQTVMGNNSLAPLDLTGAEFEAFVAESIVSIAQLSKDIGLIR